MRIMAVICSGVGARDTCVSKNIFDNRRKLVGLETKKGEI